MSGRRRRLHQWWWRQQFNPSIGAVLVNPFFFARRGLIRGMADLFPRLGGDVLDVGCGRKPYRSLVPARSYVGVDIDTPELRSMGTVDVYYDGKTLPFPDSSFDSVLCSQVLEHVFLPDEFLDEICRVLRPGGQLLLTTPMAWDEHSQPFDCARYTSFGLRDLVERAGFEILEQRKTCADLRAIVQLAAGYFFKVTQSRHRLVYFGVQLILLAPLNIVGGLLAWLLPKNSDLYLDNILLARRR